MKIKGIFLDLDNTLYSYPECDKAGRETVLKYLAEKTGVSRSKIEKAYNEGREKTHKQLHGFAASHSRLLYIQSCLEQLTGKTNFKLTLEAEELFWNAFLKKMELKKGVLEVLRKIKSKKIKICIVTDLTSQIQFRKIIKLKIEKYIDFIVSSEEAGREKPAPSIFKLALKKLNLKLSEVVMIGDDMSKDIEGAKKLGIKAITSLDLLTPYL